MPLIEQARDRARTAARVAELTEMIVAGEQVGWPARSRSGTRSPYPPAGS
jgi:hypothetical protein